MKKTEEEIPTEAKVYSKRKSEKGEKTFLNVVLKIKISRRNNQDFVNEHEAKSPKSRHGVKTLNFEKEGRNLLQIYLAPLENFIAESDIN